MLKYESRASDATQGNPGTLLEIPANPTNLRTPGM
jgi:hypothetical protein